MADFIIKSLDMIQVTIPGANIPLILAPMPLIGSSTNVMIGGQPVCLVGDEMPKEWLAPMPYTAPPFNTPGTGKLTLILLPMNMTKLTLNGKPMLLKGSIFQAIFNVATPATQPIVVGTIPDPVAAKVGTAQFITTNVLVQAS